MASLLQWLNGYALLWAPALAALAAAAVLVVRRSRVRWRAGWLAACGGVAGGLVLLRTPSGEVVQPAAADDEEGGAVVVRHDSLEWDSADSIEQAVLAAGGRPTLVEFYTDFGLG